MIEVADKRRKVRSTAVSIPQTLIYEEWDGEPVYYHGYKHVLAGTKQPEEIMSCSDIQGVLISLLVGFLHITIDRKKYLIASNEVGLNMSKGNNLGIDIAVITKDLMGPLTGKYLKTPPKIIIEVDIKADLSDLGLGEMDYFLSKSKKIIDFGTESVFWILTTSRKVVAIKKGEDRPSISDWSEDIFLFDDHSINIQQILDEEGVKW